MKTFNIIAPPHESINNFFDEVQMIKDDLEPHSTFYIDPILLGEDKIFKIIPTLEDTKSFYIQTYQPNTQELTTIKQNRIRFLIENPFIKKHINYDIAKCIFE